MRLQVRPTARKVNNIDLIQIQVENNPGMKHVKANIDTLPTELTLRIFGLLQHASAACLGLTCPRLYACLKDQYPDPICLRYHEGCGLNCDSSETSHCSAVGGYSFGWIAWEHSSHEKVLGALLKKWMGPQYTLVTLEVLRERHSFFVPSNLHNRSTGTIAWHNSVGKHVSTLWAQYNEWAKATVDNSLSIHDPLFKSRLPKPFNKGDSWYTEAMAAIKEDIIRFDDVEEWRTFWHNFEVTWESTDTFDLWVEEFSLEQMHDGIKLLGL